MITVEMSDDIRKYENKTWGPFTTRQVVCLGIGALVSTIIGLLVPVSFSNKLTIGIIALVPFILCGLVKMDGSYFESIAVNMLYLYVLTPRKRKNIQHSEFMQDYRAYEKAQEQILLSKMTSAQKKKYLATHGPNKKVQYSTREEFKIYK
ncbi:MAG: PrgI family protein [Butyrivibrio sp.]|nr:PrgI family protein [Butyrivibrio sp.]